MKLLLQAKGDTVDNGGDFDEELMRMLYLLHVEDKSGQNSERSLEEGKFKSREVIINEKKTYAIRHGYNPWLYFNWPNCKIQVRGFSRADF